MKKCISNQTYPIVETKYGKLRGYKYGSTYIYKGVDYAKANRFKKPTPPDSWDGVKTAVSYGHVCPLISYDRISNELLTPHTFWPTDENCLNLNIWTQSISNSAKKPVMVWLHGGGYMKGSAIEHQSYDGMNLSEYGDVVVVSINHRLNVLGYLSLDDYGEEYKNSGNLGQVDLVEALKWINQNIENFGGDKDNVTIFGQSGGGMKVAALMQTPAADGLYHKAIIESGVAEDFTPTLKEERKEIVQYMLKEIGIEEQNISELETVDYSILAKAFNNATESIIKRVGGLKQGAPCQNDYYFGEGRFVGFREESNNIPVMVGSCFGEFNFEESFDRLTISEDELNIKLEKYFGPRYKELIPLFKEAYPERPLSDLLQLDETFRQPSKHYVKQLSKVSNAPVYNYLLNYDFGYDDGKPAWHCAEIPFVFHNIELVPSYQMNGDEQILQDQMCKAWVNFAKIGNPNHGGIPKWDSCTEDKETTMLFSSNCETKVNYDDELAALHKQLAPNPFGNKDKIVAE